MVLELLLAEFHFLEQVCTEEDGGGGLLAVPGRFGSRSRSRPSLARAMQPLSVPCWLDVGNVGQDIPIRCLKHMLLAACVHPPPHPLAHSCVNVPQAVVLAESLSMRLPGCPSACADIMRSAVDGEVEGGGGSQSGGEEEEVGGNEEEDGGGEVARPSIGAGSSAGRPAEWGCQAGGGVGGRRQPPPCSTTKRPAASAGHVLYRPSATVRLSESRLAVASVLCSGAASSLGGLRPMDPSGYISRSGSDPAPCLEEADAAAALGRPRTVTSGSRSISGCWAAAASASCNTSGAVRPREAGPDCSRTEEQEDLDGYAHQGSSGTERYVGLLRRLFEPHWPEAGLREWVYTCSGGRASAEMVGTVGAGSGTHLPQHGSGSRYRSATRPVEWGAGSRMYLQHGEGELRAALTLVSVD